MRCRVTGSRVLAIVALAFGLAWAVDAYHSAQAGPYIEVRVSVKRIRDFSGGLPGWDLPDLGYSNFANVQAAFDRANAGNERFGRPWRYVLGNDFEGEVYGWSQYYRVEDSETTQFEVDARNNPVAFHWRDDAVNLYIVDRNLGTVSNPSCAGWASLPEDGPPLSGGAARAVVVLAACSAPLGIIAHEFGHHWGLIHTWGNDQVADTPTDADPFQCFADDGGTPSVNENCNLGGGFECCCETKAALTLNLAQQQGWTNAQFLLMRNNLMSYHCDNEDNFELSEGQLDRWADQGRLYHRAECTGKVLFVDGGNASAPWTGSSGDPFASIASGVVGASSNGGDVLVIRPGVYSETLTISKPLTLWAPRTGSFRIGG